MLDLHSATKLREWVNHGGSASVKRKLCVEPQKKGSFIVITVGGWGEKLGITHLIGIMFQGAVVTHVSHSVQICVPLVNIVHVWAVVLLIQNT